MLFFKKNKFLKILLICTSIITLFSLIEMISIESKYINQPTITFKVNNIRNPQVKKLVRFLDNTYASIYFKVSAKQKFFFLVDKDLHDRLPNKVHIEGITSNYTNSNKLSKNNSNEWHRSHGNHSSNRFSNLRNININNIENLDLAWSYKFDVSGGIQANPIFAEGLIFMPSTEKSIVAINATTGKKKWEHQTTSNPAYRGLIYNKEKESKLYFCDGKFIVAIYAHNGKNVDSFGRAGKTKLKSVCKITPAIIKDQLIIATVEPALEVYNIKSGKLIWKYFLKEKAPARHGGKRYDYQGGNPWGGISADVERELVFITTGNPSLYFQGVNRPGKNRFSNSVIAFDIKNKKLLWDFQEIEHDIWNADLPAPPILTSITRNLNKIDVVVAVSKLGNTLLLDRTSGKPIFGFDKFKAPLSTIPGEITSSHQPKIKLPEPFAKQFFSMEDISDISEESKNYIYNKIKHMEFGFFKPNSINNKNVAFNVLGGAEWMGASVDNNSGIMFVTANNLAYLTWLTKNKSKNQYYQYSSHHTILKDQNGYPGSKPPWGTLTSLNLNTGKIIWQVPFGEYYELTKKGIPKTGTLNMGGATATSGNLVFATGTTDKKIRAFNSNDGTEVWSYNLPFIGSGPPTTFLNDNEQYILVVATGSISANRSFPNEYKLGNYLYSFKLKNKNL
jgi:quinoprotein glucose dehydrogenase